MLRLYKSALLRLKEIRLFGFLSVACDSLVNSFYFTEVCLELDLCLAIGPSTNYVALNMESSILV